MKNSLHKQSGRVLGHNARSLWYTSQDESRTGAKIARDKLATKKILQQAGIATPRLHATVSSRAELKKFRWTKLPASFVIKPRAASGGGGIIVVFGRNKKGNWVKADRSEIPITEMHKHILNILDGNFSSSGVPDIALFEQRVKNHPDLKQYCAKGVADIRILIYNSVPVMAMLRLPTEESGGRANLHAGGIGVGIDLSQGTTTTATYRGQHIETLPNTRISLAGIKLPHWEKSLLSAVKAAQALDLPFAGVDIALDREDGPMILEVNSKPGLDIQLANMTPLRSRLERVTNLAVPSAKRGVKIGQNLFGASAEQEAEDSAGKPLLGVIESVNIIDEAGQEHGLQAKIDTGAWRTSIDETLAKKLGINKVIDYKKFRSGLGRQERPIIKLKFNLKEITIETEASVVDRSHMKYDLLVGRRDLTSFLIDPSKNTRGVK